MPHRIAIVTGTFPVVSETFIVDHVVGMTRRGWSPVVVCERVDAERLEVLQRTLDARLEVVPLERARPDVPRVLRHGRDLARAARRLPLRALSARAARRAVRQAPALARAFRRLRPDIVHAHFGPNGVTAALAVGGRLPLVVDFHGWDITALPSREGWGLYRQALTGARAVVHSAFAEALVRAALPLPVHRVQLGVDLARFEGPPRAERWRAPFRLLTLGRLVFQKGHHVALEALALLRHGPSPLPVELRIGGAGPERPALEALAARLHVSSHVSFTGALTYDAVAREMAETHVLLVPSLRSADGWQEAFGRVAIEGMAAGLPVVGSDTGGLSETLAAGGFVVPAADAGALARLLRELLEHPAPQAWEQRARSFALDYSLERMWDEYAEVARVACSA